MTFDVMSVAKMSRINSCTLNERVIPRNDYTFKLFIEKACMPQLIALNYINKKLTCILFLNDF